MPPPKQSKDRIDSTNDRIADLLPLLRSIQTFTPEKHPNPIYHPKSGATLGYLHSDLKSSQDILNEPLQPQLERLKESLPQLSKLWRGEQYPLFDSQGEIYDRYERGAHGLLGTRCYGIHINGIVLDSDLDSCTTNIGKGSQSIQRHAIKALWLQRRSATKKTNPLKLDTIVGGGISYNSDPASTMVKEAGEEASRRSNPFEQSRCNRQCQHFYRVHLGYDFTSILFSLTRRRRSRRVHTMLFR
jgi:hypothetical protein